MQPTLALAHQSSLPQLSPGVTVRIASNPQGYRCFQIDTLPGQEWVISYQNSDTSHPAEVKIGYDEMCGPSRLTSPVPVQSSQPADGYFLRGNDHSFVAGGGPYTVRVGFSPTGRGSWSLSARIARSNQPNPAPSRQLFNQASSYEAEARGETASTSTAATPGAHGQGQAFRDCDSCPEMVVLPAGSFMMGSMSTEEGRRPHEGPVHEVTFARAFAMGKYEVTFDEWNACVADDACAHARATGRGEGRRPVVNVSWASARIYVDWLSRRTGQRYFLPSEAEWEYAARAGTITPWNTGDALISDDANILGQFDQPVPVGGFPPNAFGLHDMHGNVAEWVLDCHDVGYFGAPRDGSAVVTPNCATRVIRGGSFVSDPVSVRSAARGYVYPGMRSPSLGFRVARAM
ncbi:MAG TPA: formylglycine-generating enzyme family protein [Allosphingosinicella sp.]|nr:formylglycine-generating enzyme family protein [Allosphingosinicella sp.]